MSDDDRVTVWDNGGKTFDRYTVAIRDIRDQWGGDYYLGIGDTGNVPNGFCMHVGGPGEVHEGDHLGEIIALGDMTEPARKAVLGELAWVDRESARLYSEKGES